MVQPENVRSPRRSWELVAVLFRGRQLPADDRRNYAVALGRWEGYPCLAVRWNSQANRPLGNPVSRQYPTWFIVPEALEAGIIATLDPEARTQAGAFLPPRR